MNGQDIIVDGGATNGPGRSNSLYGWAERGERVFFDRNQAGFFDLESADDISLVTTPG